MRPVGLAENPTAGAILVLDLRRHRFANAIRGKSVGSQPASLQPQFIHTSTDRAGEGDSLRIIRAPVVRPFLFDCDFCCDEGER